MTTNMVELPEQPLAGEVDTVELVVEVDLEMEKDKEVALEVVSGERKSIVTVVEGVVDSEVRGNFGIVVVFEVDSDTEKIELEETVRYSDSKEVTVVRLANASDLHSS